MTDSSNIQMLKIKIAEAAAKGSQYLEAMKKEVEQNKEWAGGVLESLKEFIEKEERELKNKENIKLQIDSGNLDMLRGDTSFSQENTEAEKREEIRRTYNDFWEIHQQFSKTQEKNNKDLAGVLKLMQAGHDLPKNLQSAANDNEIEQCNSWWKIGHEAYSQAHTQQKYAHHHIAKIDESLKAIDLNTEEAKTLNKRKALLHQDLNEAQRIREGFEGHIEKRNEMAHMLEEMCKHLHKKSEFKEYYEIECEKFNKIYGQKHETVLENIKQQNLLKHEPVVKHTLQHNCSSGTEHSGSLKPKSTDKISKGNNLSI